MYLLSGNRTLSRHRRMTECDSATPMAQDVCSAHLPHRPPISPEILSCLDGSLTARRRAERYRDVATRDLLRPREAAPNVDNRCCGSTSRPDRLLDSPARISPLLRNPSL